MHGILIQSILISNFTWVEVYRELSYNDIYRKYLKFYKMADEVWVYPLCGYIKDYIEKPKYVGLSCRKFNVANAQRIKKEHRQPIVFISVGRSVDLDEAIDVKSLPYDFIYTDGIYLKGENVYKLPINISNTQDYIKAADYVITKAGWSTVAEAICARKPMLVIERNELAEDRKTLEIVMQLGIALPVRQNEFNEAGISRLLGEANIKSLNYNGLPGIYNNSVDEIADDILRHLTDCARSEEREKKQ